MTPDTLCVMVGGLGGNQWLMGSPSPLDQIQAACPNALCTHLSDCGYIFGVIPPIIQHIAGVKAANPGITRVIAIGHSMGWIAIAKAAIEGAATAIAAIDPVGLCGVSHDAWPNHVRGIYVKAAPTIFITPLQISDAPPPYIFTCGHNELPPDPNLIAALVRLTQES